MNREIISAKGSESHAAQILGCARSTTVRQRSSPLFGFFPFCPHLSDSPISPLIPTLMTTSYRGLIISRPAETDTNPWSIRGPLDLFHR